MLAIVALLLSGCSGNKTPDTIESLVNSDEELATSIQKQAEAVGCDMDIKDNIITYTFDISTVDGITEELIRSDEFVESLKASIESQDEALSEFCKSVEKETDVEGVVLNVIYKFGDKEIVSSTFSASDQTEN